MAQLLNFVVAYPISLLTQVTTLYNPLPPFQYTTDGQGVYSVLNQAGMVRDTTVASAGFPFSIDALTGSNVHPLPVNSLTTNSSNNVFGNGDQTINVVQINTSLAHIEPGYSRVRIDYTDNASVARTEYFDCPFYEGWNVTGNELNQIVNFGEGAFDLLQTEVGNIRSEMNYLATHEFWKGTSVSGQLQWTPATTGLYSGALTSSQFPHNMPEPAMKTVVDSKYMTPKTTLTSDNWRAAVFGSNFNGSPLTQQLDASNNPVDISGTSSTTENGYVTDTHWYMSEAVYNGQKAFVFSFYGEVFNDAALWGANIWSFLFSMPSGVLDKSITQTKQYYGLTYVTSTGNGNIATSTSFSNDLLSGKTNPNIMGGVNNSLGFGRSVWAYGIQFIGDNTSHYLQVPTDADIANTAWPDESSGNFTKINDTIIVAGANCFRTVLIPTQTATAITLVKIYEGNCSARQFNSNGHGFTASSLATVNQTLNLVPVTQPPPPTIPTVTSTSGICYGQNVLIQGTGLDQVTSVNFNGAPVTFTATGSTILTLNTSTLAISYAPGIPYYINLLYAGGQVPTLTKVNSSCYPQPQITSISPVCPGGTFTITGTNLRFTDPSNNITSLQVALTVNNEDVLPSVTTNTSTQIIAVAPADLSTIANTTYPVVLTTQIGSTTANLTINTGCAPAPIITSVTAACPGGTFTINGSHLTGITNATFTDAANNITPFTTSFVSDSQVTGTVPTTITNIGGTTFTINVTTNTGSTGTGTNGTFVVPNNCDLPTITSVTPACPGNLFYVYGTNLLGITNAYFTDAQNKVTPFTAEQLDNSHFNGTVPTTISPIAGTTYTISVVTLGGATSGSTNGTFIVPNGCILNPTITDISTPVCNNGSVVTVHGNNLGNSSLNYVYTVNGINVSVNFFAGGLTFNLPNGITGNSNVNFVIDPSAYGLSKASISFYVQAMPQVYQLTDTTRSLPANHYFSNDNINISGIGFGPTTGTVIFTDVSLIQHPATVLSWNDGFIAATVPNLPKGTYTLQVNNIQCGASQSGYQTTSHGTLVGPPPQLAVTPISVNLIQGQVQQFEAYLAKSSFFTNLVTNQASWSVNGIAGGNSSVGIIDSTGFYTAPASITSNSTVTVQASYVYVPSPDDGYGGTYTATSTINLVGTVGFTSPTLNLSIASQINVFLGDSRLGYVPVGTTYSAYPGNYIYVKFNEVIDPLTKLPDPTYMNIQQLNLYSKSALDPNIASEIYNTTPLSQITYNNKNMVLTQRTVVLGIVDPSDGNWHSMWDIGLPQAAFYGGNIAHSMPEAKTAPIYYAESLPAFSPGHEFTGSILDYIDDIAGAHQKQLTMLNKRSNLLITGNCFYDSITGIFSIIDLIQVFSVDEAGCYKTLLSIPSQEIKINEQEFLWVRKDDDLLHTSRLGDSFNPNNIILGICSDRFYTKWPILPQYMITFEENS